ncbi:radical SAM protein [Streptomyces sp. NPDC029004]|uniref:radical SAM protein n=1 Tax=Streptomyces sp. NPDC029004 TaxID=3154490 RepID=UPI00340AEC0F
MQPTTLCNLDCKYCYLPYRHKRQDMPAAVQRAAAGAAARWTESGHRLEILWHAGEPLTVGVRKFGELLSAWPPRTVHRVQTNATLIDDAWCDLFDRYRVLVSVSIDGPGAMNGDRVTRVGAPAGRRIEAGTAALIRRGIPFDMLSVVRDPSPDAARSIYAHACALGADQLGVLPEETKGTHRDAPQAARRAWADFFHVLYSQWRANPVVRLRELESVANCYDAIRTGVTPEEIQALPVEPIPTVCYDGEVTVMSPDLAGFGHPRHGLFTVGNVLEYPLEDLLDRAGAVAWVREALNGVDACRRTCRYVGACGGSWPANKFFELGRLDATETSYCRNLHQAKVEGALLCRP